MVRLLSDSIRLCERNPASRESAFVGSGHGHQLGTASFSDSTALPSRFDNRGIRFEFSVKVIVFLSMTFTEQAFPAHRLMECDSIDNQTFTM